MTVQCYRYMTPELPTVITINLRSIQGPLISKYERQNFTEEIFSDFIIFLLAPDHCRHVGTSLSIYPVDKRFSEKENENF